MAVPAGASAPGGPKRLPAQSARATTLGPEIAGMSDQTVSSYSAFDFRALWKDRDVVTEVERALVDRELRSAAPTRVLEVGTGFGRLSPGVADRAEELVVSDFDRGALERLEWPAGVRLPALRVALNLYHLPFLAETFGAATLVRVHHHLGDPQAALRELARVLRPSGRLLISYNPRPSVGTIVHALRRRIADAPSGPAFGTRFARPGRLRMPSGPFPVYVPLRREFRSDALAAGFVVDHELGSGLEEFSLLRRLLPPRFFIAASGSIGRAPGAPTRWALLVREGGRSAAEATPPPLWECLACPRCRQPMRYPAGEGPSLCRGCGFQGERRGDLLDLRYLPHGTPVATASAGAIGGSARPALYAEGRGARASPHGPPGVAHGPP